jgi:hypothetical protein
MQFLAGRWNALALLSTSERGSPNCLNGSEARVNQRCANLKSSRKRHPLRLGICSSASFLVPEAEFHKIWTTIQKEPDRFQKIARHFKVSEIVAARRALDLKGITRDEFLKFYRDYTKDWAATTNKKTGGDFYANQPFRIGRRFGESVVRATREGKLLYRDAYRLTGLYGKTFEKYSYSECLQSI